MEYSTENFQNYMNYNITIKKLNRDSKERERSKSKWQKAFGMLDKIRSNDTSRNLETFGIMTKLPGKTGTMEEYQNEPRSTYLEMMDYQGI